MNIDPSLTNTKFKDRKKIDTRLMWRKLKIKAQHFYKLNKYMKMYTIFRHRKTKYNISPKRNHKFMQYQPINYNSIFHWISQSILSFFFYSEKPIAKISQF